MQIISERHEVVQVNKVHNFEWVDCPGAGFGFDCDSTGNIIVTDDNRQNVEFCLAEARKPEGERKVIDCGVEEFVHRYMQPAIGRCDCGHEVPLDGFTNTCDSCGADYNMSGQRLAPRSFWGEETGETLSDILSIA